MPEEHSQIICIQNQNTGIVNPQSQDVNNWGRNDHVPAPVIGVNGTNCNVTLMRDGTAEAESSTASAWQVLGAKLNHQNRATQRVFEVGGYRMYI